MGDQWQPADPFATPASWTPAQASPIAPKRRGSSALIVGLSVGALLASIAAGTAVGTAIGKDKNTPAITTVSPELKETRARILTELPRLIAFVAKARGHEWVRQPTVEVLADKEFVQAINGGGGDAAGPADDPADPDDVGVTYTALGVADSADSFSNDSSDSQDSNVVGVYDDTTKRLIVRGTTWTPSMEYTLVHELTHALQDQTFDLGALAKKTRYDDESADSLQAVIEGDAVRIADHFFDTQTKAWQRSVTGEGGGGSGTPTFVDSLSALPYDLGASFMEKLETARATAGVDQAFLHPPTTSAQLLQPVAWLAGKVADQPKSAFPPAAEDDVADRGSLGVTGLWLVVDYQNPHPTQTAALLGWVGDRYTSTDDGDNSCITDIIKFTNADSRSKATTFLTSWANDADAKLTNSGDATLTLQVCHPS